MKLISQDLTPKCARTKRDSHYLASNGKADYAKESISKNPVREKNNGRYIGRKKGVRLTPNAVSEVIHRRATSAAVSNTRGIRFFVKS